MQKICLVGTSVASKAEARALAEGAVAAHLAACVQTAGPGESLYLWQGSVTTEQEWYLTLKTSMEKCGELIDWLGRQHPYELPEIICSQVEATEEYAGWLRGCLIGDAGGANG